MSMGLTTFSQTPVSPRASNEMRTFATRLLSNHLPRPLKSVAFLEQAGFLFDVDGSQGE
jgi:hypothetical protein